MTIRPFPTAGASQYGDREVARSGEILRTEVGSGLHGVTIGDTGDHDEMGVYIEPPQAVIGMDGPYDHYVSRTQPEGRRSGHGDTDLVMYSLRKYLRLATAGNPTVLLPLFAPEPAVYALTPVGAQLRGMAELFLSRQAVHRFLGFLDKQADGLAGGERPSTVAQRPELVERFGYDVKRASHALRLAYQGVEIARHGRLTVPMPDAERRHVREVKAGERSLQEVLAEVTALRSTIVDLLADGCVVPDQPDMARLSAWSVTAHRAHWGWT